GRRRAWGAGAQLCSAPGWAHRDSRGHRRRRDGAGRRFRHRNAGRRGTREAEVGGPPSLKFFLSRLVWAGGTKSGENYGDRGSITKTWIPAVAGTIEGTH